MSFFSTGPGSLAADSTPSSMEAFIENLISQMTLQEKLGQLTQSSGKWNNTGPTVAEGGEKEIRNGEIGSFLSVYGADYTRELQQIAVEQSRLGIPLLFAHDVIHGFRTIFPVPLAEASSWDLEAVEQAARIAAIEATAHGVHWTYAPMVDVSRDPRWGRVVEGSGEDPYLASKMATARVRGFQGNDLQSKDTLLACAKHFAAYGGAEGGRDYNVVDISDRTLRETYLPPFKAALDAGVETFMAAFNEISGVPCHANRKLTHDILRKEWGFEGMVVSDYTGVMELMKHGVASTPGDAGVLALESGVDVDMVSNIYVTDLDEQVAEGNLKEDTIDEAVRRVLRAKYKLGLFEDPYRYSDKSRELGLTLTASHREAARRMAAKSMVLLKNEGNLLPLSKQSGRIAVIGSLARNPWVGIGNWGAAGRQEEVVTILEGIREAVGDDTGIVYADGVDVWGEDRSGFDEAIEAAEESDVVIMVVGESPDMSAEANNRTSLDLPGVQLELVQAIHKTGKPIVVVLTNGRPLSIPWIDDHVPAILEAWFGGIEMGHALADILFGDVNPGGKLTVTFPFNGGQIPIYYNHKNTGRPADLNDKYTSKYLDAPWTPLYVFGHGLSYTTFEYRNLGISQPEIHPDGHVTVTVEVVNTGERAGVEVVQLYMQDVVGSVTRPVRELRGFERIELEAGKSRVVEFILGPEELACYDLEMKKRVEPGLFRIFVGGSSAADLETSFRVVESQL